MRIAMQAAIAFAAEKHHSQRRKATGEPYICHPLRVAYLALDAGLSEDAVCAAILHDVVEDTDAKFDDLLPIATKEAISLISRLTKWWDDHAPQHVKEEGKIDYYRFIMGHPESINLKLLDRIDNLRDMIRVLPQNKRWATKYLAKTKAEITPLWIASDNAAIKELYAVTVAELEKKLS